MSRFFCGIFKNKVSSSSGGRSKKKIPSLPTLSTEVKTDLSLQSTQRLSHTETSRYERGMQLVRQEDADGALKEFVMVLFEPPWGININFLNKHCVELLGLLILAHRNQVALQHCKELINVTKDNDKNAHSKYIAIKELLEGKKSASYKEFNALLAKLEVEKPDTDSSTNFRSHSFSYIKN